MHRIELISGKKDIFENITIRRGPVIQPSKLGMNPPQGNSQEEPRDVTGFDRPTLLALLGNIQKYAPGQNLNTFIRQVDTLMKFLQGKLTPNSEFLVNFSIKLKILGEAQWEADWESVRRVLLQKYGDHRTEEALIASLHRCVHEDRESVEEYHDRVFKILNCLLQKIAINEIYPNYVTFKTSEYSQLSKNVFLGGIREPYRTYLDYHNPENLEQSLARCKHYNEKLSEWYNADNIRSQKCRQHAPRAN